MAELRCNCNSVLCYQPEGVRGKPVDQPHPGQMYDYDGPVGKEWRIGICEKCYERNVGVKGIQK
jgi:hypothetical protein